MRSIVEEFRQKRGAWATIGDHVQSSSYNTIWYPIVDLNPKTVDLSVAVSKSADDEWALAIDNKEIDWAQKPDELRERFDRDLRYRLIRAKALPLTPSDDQARELVECLQHPKTAKQGDYVLVYKEGGVLDVVQIRKIKPKSGNHW